MRNREIYVGHANIYPRDAWPSRARVFGLPPVRPTLQPLETTR